jgi:predicted enzyme related to lactoylglutathione lyase
MVSGVAAVWMPVQDMDRAIEFYGQTLGLKVDRKEERWAEVDANGLLIGLNGRESEGAGAEGGPVVSFQPDGDLEEAKADLEGKGVSFTEISEHPWGRITTFQDSEGNDLQLYVPPGA